jgi:SnoaL-like domain
MSEPHAFRRAIETGDRDLLRDTLREDIVFHSPVLFRPFEGRDIALHVMEAVKEILTDFTYTNEATELGAVALRFRALAGDRELEGIDFLELDEGGRVRRITVFMRPMSALNSFSQAMAERLGLDSEAAIATKGG